MSKKQTQVNIAEIKDGIALGRPIIGSATADAVAVLKEGMKGKGHNKGGKHQLKPGRKATTHDVKMVARGLALAKRIEDATEHKRQWVLDLQSLSSVALRDVSKGVGDFYDAKVKEVRTGETLDGQVTVGGSKSVASLQVRKTEITRVIEAMRRAVTLKEDGDSESHDAVMVSLNAAKGWNNLYALAVQIRQEANSKPLTAAAVKEAVNKVFSERQAKPMTEKESDKWCDQARRFKSSPPAQLFRLIQAVVSVAVQTPGLAKFADVRKLAESVKLTKLLSKHSNAERSKVESISDARKRMAVADKAVGEMQKHVTSFQAVSGRVVGSRKAA